MGNEKINYPGLEGVLRQIDTIPTPTSNSLVLILSVGRRDINLNYYTGQLEPLPYQQ